MKKPDLIKQVASVSGLAERKASKAIKALVKVIQSTLKNGDVISLSGLGSFRVKSTRAKQGRNPKTKEPVSIPAGIKVSFKPTATLKKIIKL
jgi:nucleoid DNA-binding protein